MAFELSTYLADRAAMVNARLTEILSELPPGRLSEAMTYSALSGGKRLRPILCMAGSEAVGGSASDVLTVACALELIHAFSLIHDDLPAMDDDDLRRGKPTCHKAFDEATAILAGDALLCLAFRLISSQAPGNVHPTQILKVSAHIADATGCLGMTGGQMLDILGESRAMNLDELQDMHRKKTGALIEASVFAGAVLGAGDSGRIAALSKYAGLIGLAFQVTDDILNIEGDAKLLGKAVGTDAMRHKATFPALLGMEQAKSHAQGLINEALQAISGFDTKSDPLRALARYIISRHR